MSLSQKEFYDTVYYVKISGGSISNHLKNLVRKLDIPFNSAALDVGCGTGELLAALSESGAVCSGIDISERAVAFAKERLPKAEIHTGKAEHLPFSDNKFDLITCLGCLEHFENPKIALREMIRVAKPDASILILVPNKYFLSRQLGFFSGTEQKKVKELVLSIEEWEKLFSASGLTVIDKWKDLHVLSKHWIFMRGVLKAPLRALQAIALIFWPLKWQYQVYFRCQISVSTSQS